jgi:hypothetical protein
VESKRREREKKREDVVTISNQLIFLLLFSV